MRTPSRNLSLSCGKTLIPLGKSINYVVVSNMIEKRLKPLQDKLAAVENSLRSKLKLYERRINMLEEATNVGSTTASVNSTHDKIQPVNSSVKNIMYELGKCSGQQEKPKQQVYRSTKLVETNNTLDCPHLNKRPIDYICLGANQRRKASISMKDGIVINDSKISSKSIGKISRSVMSPVYSSKQKPRMSFASSKRLNQLVSYPQAKSPTKPPPLSKSPEKEVSAGGPETPIITFSLPPMGEIVTKFNMIDTSRFQKLNEFSFVPLDPQEQLSELLKITEESDDYYAISSEWWRKWCDYVNISFTSLDSIWKIGANIGKFRPCEEPTAHLQPDEALDPISIDSVSNSDEDPINHAISALTKTSHCISTSSVKTQSPSCHFYSSVLIDESSPTLDTYSHPGLITNHKIVDLDFHVEVEDGVFVNCLRENLNELHDYVKVQEPVWRLFKKWYGCDYEVYIE